MIRRAITLFLVVGLAATPLIPQETGSSALISTEDVPADAAITERLSAILSGLGHPEIGITVQAGVVTLSGDIADPALRGELSEITGRVEGVVAVRNRTTEGGEIGDRLDPAFERLRGRLAQVAGSLPLVLLAAI